MYRLLIVEDDIENCNLLAMCFQKTGEYDCVYAHDATAALTAVEKGRFDLILLDIMLPGIDGIDLCIRLREKLYCPIIFMSCLDDESTIVRALDMGGDDYITKPFRFSVLNAHIKAMLRRTVFSAKTAGEQYEIGDKTFSTKDHALICGDMVTVLSPTEYELLLLFVNNPQCVLEFEDIYQHIWKRNSMGDLRTVFSHVRNLRKKLEIDPNNPRYIQTVARSGYRFSFNGD